MAVSIRPSNSVVGSIQRQWAKVGVRIPTGPFRAVLPWDRSLCSQQSCLELGSNKWRRPELKAAGGAESSPRLP
eukprot:2209221-Prymnesium_polylepis.1